MSQSGYIAKCDRCEEPVDDDDRDFIVDSPEGDCSEFVCRQCRLTKEMD